MGLTEEFRRTLESLRITSAGGNNPVENKIISVGELPDLDAAIREGQQNDPDFVKEKTAVDNSVARVKDFDRGNVGQIQSLTSNQFGNLRGFALNPVGFMISSVFNKFAKGAGIAGLALIFFEVIKFVIAELLKPGRFLDRRFKRDISNEILAFRSREEKQKIRQGFSQIIVTTIGRLRDGTGQSTNTLRQTAGIDPQIINRTFTQPRTMEAAAGVPMSVAKGKKRFRQ